MNSINLQQSLSQFTGTEHYYRISKLHLLTDGTKFLADEAKCYWLMDAIASYLPKSFNDDFAVAMNRPGIRGGWLGQMVNSPKRAAR